MKALVTGGGGFLGKAIVLALLGRGDSVRSFARGDYPELVSLGADVVRGDIEDAASVRAACRGVEVVFHVAAKAGIWGKREEFYGPNVRGTENVLAACSSEGVSRLVFTSSPSVVFSGKDIEGADESLPYPGSYHSFYAETKALSEKLVLAANGERLATVALRPHLIWGPGDNHLVPRIVARARAGVLRRIGRGDNKVDTIYVDNAVSAHLLAADRLAPGSKVAGNAYFLSNGEPRPLWEMIDRILAAAGVPPVERSVSHGMARLAGATFELTHKLLGLAGEPRMTRFLADELATSHWFDISAARRDLDYKPAVSIDEGLVRLEASLRGSAAMRAPSPAA
ncbi:NAD-dependent epimerase/dehydratase family protein [bacterium]|nr:NAD-dependent epimerase/dehydratase family protein [bacterium]